MRALLLVLFAAAAAAQEVPLTPPVYGPAAWNQMFAAAASDGNDYLVVWIDHRAWPLATYATRVTRDGVPIDGTGIRIDVDFGFEPKEVVWTGEFWLIVWDTGGRGHIYAAHVGRDGSLLRAPYVLADDGQLPDVIRAGEHTVVAYLSSTYSLQPRALFLDAGGNVVSRFDFARPSSNYGSPRVAWNGSHLLAVWTQGAITESAITVKALRLNVAGPVDAEPETIFPSGYNVDLAIASDGSDFLLVARDYDTSVHRAIRIGADLQSAGFVRHLPQEIASTTTLLWTGSNYVAVAHNGLTMAAVRLGRDGTPIDPHGIVLETVDALSGAPRPAAATNGSDLFVAWDALADETRPYEGNDIIGGVFAASTLTPRSRQVLSVSARRQRNTVIASSGANLLTLWSESNGTFVRRTTLDGSPIDPTPLALTAREAQVSVAFNGTDYIVAWMDQAWPWRLMVARVPANGDLRVASVVHRDVADSSGYISLASDGAATLLVYSDFDRLVATRVEANGSFADAEPVTITTGLIGPASVAGSDGDAFLVVWGDLQEVCCHHNIYPRSVRGARVTPELTVLDFDGFDVATTEAFEGNPDVTWNGREWLVVWERELPPAMSSIQGRRVSPEGTLLNGAAGDEGMLLAFGAMAPGVTWDGERYFLSWIDAYQYSQRALRGGWVREGQWAMPSVVFGELDGAGLTAPASLVALAPGRVVAGYSRLALEPAYGGVSRAFLNVIRLVSRRRAVR